MLTVVEVVLEQEVLKTTVFLKQVGRWSRKLREKSKVMQSQALFSVWSLSKAVGLKIAMKRLMVIEMMMYTELTQKVLVRGHWMWACLKELVLIVKIC